jgi:type I restriction enzyme M protein
MKADGKSLDDKRSLLVDENIFNSFLITGSLSREQQDKVHSNFNLPDIIARYSNRYNENHARTEQSFLIPFSEIQANDWDLSINRYKETVHEEVAYDSPAVILSVIKQLDAERTEALKKLEELIG